MLYIFISPCSSFLVFSPVDLRAETDGRTGTSALVIYLTLPAPPARLLSAGEIPGHASADPPVTTRVNTVHNPVIMEHINQQRIRRFECSQNKVIVK